MLKMGQNWGKIANYPPRCSTKIGTPDSVKILVENNANTVCAFSLGLLLLFC